MAASNAADGSGAGVGAGAAGWGSDAELAVTVDVVPLELTEPLEESIEATASCSFPDAFDVDVAVTDSSDADRPELLVDALVRRLANTVEAVPPRWVELAVPVPLGAPPPRTGRN